MKLSAPFAALALSVALGGIAPTLAQEAAPPPDQRCGGLLCDMGLFQGGGRDPAFGPAPDCGFFCRITGGGPAADAAAAQQRAQAEAQAAAAAAPPPETAKTHHRAKRHHVAKATKKSAAPAEATPAATEPAPAK